jgi:hypothetical protein
VVSGEELGERKGFRQVVVTARLQSANAIIDRAFRAQEKNRGRAPRGAQSFHETDAVELRQHDVDDGRVVIGRFDQRQTRLAIRRVVNRVTGLLETTGDERGDFGIIFDDEDAHDNEEEGRGSADE